MHKCMYYSILKQSTKTAKQLKQTSSKASAWNAILSYISGLNERHVSIKTAILFVISCICHPKVISTCTVTASKCRLPVAIPEEYTVNI